MRLSRSRPFPAYADNDGVKPDQYDDIRKKLRGVEFRYGINAAQLDPQIRNRAAYRLTLPQHYDGEHHDAGHFNFAGYFWTWEFDDCLGFVTLTLDIDEDLLMGE